MQELNTSEIEEVSGSGGSIFYEIGQACGNFLRWAQVKDDEWAWSGGG
ncbi:hypothetical protein ACO0K0_20425 [Undibacterium sp. SXout11W]